MKSDHRATIAVVPHPGDPKPYQRFHVQVDGVEALNETGGVWCGTESEANAKMSELAKSEMQELNQPAERQIQEMIRKYGFSSEEGECAVSTVNSAIRKVVNELASTPPAHVFRYAAELLRAECSCGWTWQDCSKEFGRAVWVEHSSKVTQERAAQPAVVATRTEIKGGS